VKQNVTRCYDLFVRFFRCDFRFVGW